jgi:threonine 3-dehydrogenase
MAIAVARLCGAAKIIAVEPNTARADLAKRMGANIVINPAKENAAQTIKELTGFGADIVLEYSGNTRGVESVFDFVRPEGKIAFVGLPSGKSNIEFAEFIYRGVTLKGIAGRKIYNTWEDMKGLFAAGLNLDPIVSHVLPLSQYDKGLAMMASGECIKTILKP